MSDERTYPFGGGEGARLTMRELLGLGTAQAVLSVAAIEHSGSWTVNVQLEAQAMLKVVAACPSRTVAQGVTIAVAEAFGVEWRVIG